MIDIYRRRGSVTECIFSTPIFSGSKRKYTLMSEDFLTLKFSLLNPIKFRLGDFISDSRFGNFELVDIYIPTYNSKTGAYDYNIRFDAQYYKWKNKICKFTPETGGRETTWNLTASLDVHLEIFLRNLTSLGYNEYGDAKSEYYFSIDSTVENSAKLVSYNNTNLINVLNTLAETWECEWWIINNCIYFGKCERETDIVFERDVNMEDISSSSSSSTYGTRLYAFGSDKNLPTNYRKVDSEIVVNGIVQRRLMLPSEVPYIDIESDLNNEEYVEIVKIFDDVYPKTEGIISSVDYYEDSVKDEETEEVITEKFYLFADDNFNFSKDYILEGEDLKIKFESGLLNGMEFGVTFHTKEEANNRFELDKQTWEIVANEDYGIKLPNDTLYPSVGDKYILLNWDSTKIAELGLVDKAENELLEKAQEYIKKISIDPNTYTCKIFTSSAKELYIEDNIQSLYNVGDAVKLVDSVFFKEGFRKSRIIGFEYNLDIPYDTPIYTVGESIAYSRLGDIEGKLDALIFKGETYKGVSGSSVYVISRYDKTPANDYNVYSALRVDKYFFNKAKDENINGYPTFKKGFKAEDLSILTETIIRQYISSPTFIDGFFGEGFKLWHDENLISHLTVDNLTVRQIQRVFELIIQKERAICGGLIISPANGKIKDVNTNDYYYIIEFEDRNMFFAGDYMRCQTYSGNTKSYWVEVDYINNECVYISKSKFTDAIPEVGDEVMLCGSRNKERQGLIRISSVEGDMPKVEILSDVNTIGSFVNCTKVRIGYLGDIVDMLLGNNQPKGYGIYSDNAYLKGEFILNRTGENVATKFEITEQGLRSAVGTLQRDNTKTILYNGSFTYGLKGWISTNNNGTYILLNNNPIFINDNAVLINKENNTSADYVNDRYVARVNNDELIQLNDNFVNKPIINEEKHVPLTFSLNVRALSDAKILLYLSGNDLSLENALSYIGTSTEDYSDGDYISINLPNGSAVLFEDIHGDIYGGQLYAVVKNSESYSLYNITTKQKIECNVITNIDNAVETVTQPCVFIGLQDVSQSETFNTLNFESKWNGKGHLHVSVEGEVEITNLSMYTDDTEVRHATLFEQSEKLIKIAATNFDSEGNILESSSIVTQAEFNAMMSEKFNEDGSLKNTAGIITSTDLDELKESGDIISFNYVNKSINNLSEGVNKEIKELSESVDENINNLAENMVTVESFAGMFAEAVNKEENIVKQAQLTAYVTKDSDGNLESGVKVVADNINLTGYNIEVDTANFKVRDDGSIFAKNGEFSGIVKNRPTYVTPEKVNKFFTIDEYTNHYFNNEQLSSCMIFEGTFDTANVLSIILPYLSCQEHTNREPYTKEEVELARSFIGVEISIYNNTSNRIFIDAGSGSSVDQDVTLQPNSYVSYKCILGGYYLDSWLASGKPTENIYWEKQHYNSRSRLIIGV